MLLADSAQADVSGKAHALGLGWNIASTPTPPMALLLLIEVGWNEANERHRISAELHDEDGSPVLVPGDGGVHVPIRFEGDYEVGRPPGSVPGMPLGIPIVINVGPGIPLQSGKRYRWHVENSGEPGADLSVGFFVR